MNNSSLTLRSYTANKFHNIFRRTVSKLFPQLNFFYDRLSSFLSRSGYNSNTKAVMIMAIITMTSYGGDYDSNDDEDLHINCFSVYWFTLELTAATVFGFRKSECVRVSTQPHLFVSTKLQQEHCKNFLSSRKRLAHFRFDKI